MNNYTLVPIHYACIVRDINAVAQRAMVGTVPTVSGSEIMLNSLKEINSAFSEMTAALKNRDKSSWQTSR